ncbi:MAG: protein translocase subunit SecD, partial [Pseudomonadota bacterium]
MLNKTPVWKYLLIILMLSLGCLYAMPNLYPPDYAVQITAKSHSTPVDERQLKRALNMLSDIELPCQGYELSSNQLLLRFKSTDAQSKAHDYLKPRFGDDYVVALSTAPTTPSWLTSIGAHPLKLGLDLAGGVHFLLMVQTDHALETRANSLVAEIKRELRDANIPAQVSKRAENIVVNFKSEDHLRLGKRHLRNDMKMLLQETVDSADLHQLMLTLSEEERLSVRNLAVNKNLITLRNRANELGVSEPLVHRQGADKIVVELPGIQDTAEAKRILGKTATLEFRFAAESDTSHANKQKFLFRSDNRGVTNAFLERDVIISGEHVSNAQGSFDEFGKPKVDISLQGEGGALLNYATRKNVGRGLGVLLVERKIQTTYDSDFIVLDERAYYDRTIISLATVQ